MSGKYWVISKEKRSIKKYRYNQYEKALEALEELYWKTGEKFELKLKED